MSQLGDEGGSFFGSGDRLRKELERLLERAKDQGERALDAIGIKQSSWQPMADVIETPEEVLIYLDLPGMTADQLSLEIVGNMLTISGTRFEKTAAPGEIVHARQRLTGSFGKSIPLPVPVDHDRVTAEMHNGVLTIRVGKAERAKSHKVPISVKAS